MKLKRSCTIIIAALIIIAMSTTVLAANNSFDSIPAGHWTYNAMAKLTKDGLVSGYGEETFANDKTFNRYEFAVMLQKTMGNYIEATEEDKQLIDKLSAEFARELNSMGVWVAKAEPKPETAPDAKLPAKPSPIFYGSLESRYANAKDLGMYYFGGTDAKRSGFYHRADIGMIVPVSPKVTFIGEVFAGSRDASNVTDRTNNTSVTVAMVSVKQNNAEYRFGRLAFLQGLGLTGTTPYFDGGSAGIKTDKLSATLAVGNTFITTYDPSPVPVINTMNKTFYALDTAYAPDKDKKIVATLWQDADRDVYNTITAGYRQEFAKDWVFSGEYGQNSSELAKHKNDGSSAQAFFLRFKYKGAVPSKVGSNGASITYLKADPYFDPCSTTLIETTPHGWNFPTNGSNIDNAKGFVFSYEHTIFDNIVFKINFAPVKRVKDMNGVPDNRRYVTASAKLTF